MVAQQANLTDAIATSRGPSLRVLIVEDYPDCALSLEMLLRLFGHDVQVVHDGESALTEAQAYEPDVILLDLGLPGLTGYEVARHVRSLRPAKRPLVIATTGFGQTEARRQSYEAGTDMHLLKPVEPELLRSVLERFQAVISGQPCIS